MNLPEDFISYTKALMGDELFSTLEQGLTAGESAVSIRLNPFKCPPSTRIRHNEGEKDSVRVPWCTETGRILPFRPNFTFDPLLHAGLYYVQEAASMFVDRAIRQYVDRQVLMLDLCAAPGGKSTAVRAALPEGSVLISNEPMRPRANILRENILKFGHPDMLVTNNYPQDYRKTHLQFDVLLADVPCSGEGMFRKDTDAISEWSVQNVEKCWRLQREIITDIWDNLKPGGLLIYSTCTFNVHEDEENVEWIARELGADLLPVETEATWNITGSLLSDQPMYRFLPGKTQGEGLFMAVLRKHGEAVKREEKKKGKTRDKGKKNNTKQPVPDANWLKPGREYTYKTLGENIHAIPKEWEDVYNEAEQHLRLLHAGVEIGSVKGKDILPGQGLALSTMLNKEAFPTVELSYENAIAYLRKEAITLPEGTPRGQVLVCYRGYPLGGMKNLGNRANNQYPQEWKIKSTHTPEGDNNLLVW